MIKRIFLLAAGLLCGAATISAEPLLGALPLFDMKSVSVPTLGGGGGAFIAGTTKPIGCTASTLLWVDSGGLVQCGATVTATATTSLRLGNGAAGTPSYTFGTGVSGLFTVNPANGVSISAGGFEITRWNSSGLDSGASAIFFGSALGNVDVTLSRVAASVAGPAAGSWWQNVSGEASLAANYTNATNTLSATNLNYTVISGRHYNFDLEVHLTESTAAEGVQIAFDGGSAAATDFVVDCYLTNTGGAIAMTNSFATALATVINAGTTVVTTQSGLHCHGMFTPSGAGTFILRAAQNTHATGTLTFLKGSSLVLRDTKVL